METAVVIVGAGFAGCAAAVAAAKAGVSVALLEKNDVLLGTGLYGGIIRNNGRFTAAEELIAMGAGDIVALCDRTARHRGIDFPAHRHATLCDCVRLPGEVERLLRGYGVQICLQSRICRAESSGGRVVSVATEGGQHFRAQAFVDATGSSGPMGNCFLYGNGCAMCALKCPSFGGRLSLAELAGLTEGALVRDDGGLGAMSGSCSLFMESLDRELQQRLRQDGVAVLPIPDSVMTLLTELNRRKRGPGVVERIGAALISELREVRSMGQLAKRIARLFRNLLRLRGFPSAPALTGIKACRQYALPDFAENLVLLDTGHVKLMAPHWNMAALRRMPGLEGAVLAAPLGASRTNSMRFFAHTRCSETLAAQGLSNLFCAGEKTGLLGHTEAMLTGSLAGLNAGRLSLGLEGLRIPVGLACGDILAQATQRKQTDPPPHLTFSGSSYFARMLERGLYGTDREEIRRRVRQAGAENLLGASPCP